MRDIIKKVLIENLTDKKLQMAYVYFSNYMDSLQEVIYEDSGNIYLSEYGHRYADVGIKKKQSECWVSIPFWKKFSDEFSLKEYEFELIITKWVEDTYGLKGINIGRTIRISETKLNVSTN